MSHAQLTPNALTVLKQRYLWRKKKGSQESPEEMFHRVAKSVSRGSKSLEKRFFDAMSALEFLPNSPTLMNAGKKNGQLAACFVLPIPDDLSGIMDTLKATALIHQSGGGTGFSFSTLRGEKSSVNSSGGYAAGPIGFLSLFNELTQTIKQGGLRRGANMGVLQVDHADVEAFINCKSNINKITNFNISVAVTDNFMKAVRNAGSWNLKDPRDGKTVKSVRAKEIFDSLCLAAWTTGEPGLIFIDEINRNNPTPTAGEIEATNPCGEQPLLPYEACNLGSINLNAIFSLGSDGVDWNKFGHLIETGVLFLDQVIDCCHYPLAEINKLCHAHRKIGLGVMGFADLLLKLKIPYGSPESLKLADKVMRFVRDQCIQVSQKLAQVSEPFEGYSKSLWKKRGIKPLRNAALTTVAPTGTISLLANASAGIEPVFSYAYQRHVLDGEVLWEIHPQFKTLMERHNLRYTDLETCAKEGTLVNLPLPDEIKSIFLTTGDLSFENHVKIQAAFQKHSDSGVSKTINLRQCSSVEEVKKAFQLAYELRCKGITVYRDGSRPNQVLQLDSCPDCARIS